MTRWRSLIVRHMSLPVRTPFRWIRFFKAARPVVILPSVRVKDWSASDPLHVASCEVAPHVDADAECGLKPSVGGELRNPAHCDRAFQSNVIANSNPS